MSIVSGALTRRRSAFTLPGGSVPLLGLAALSAALWIGRWLIASQRAFGDTFWYTRLALGLSGMSGADATRHAAEFLVAMRGGSVAAWVDLAGTIDPRYPGIFLERPFYPLTASVLVPFAGTDAMAVSSGIAGVVAGVVLGWFAFRALGSWVAAFGVTILLFILPSGDAMAALLADGWMLAWWITALAAASLFLRDRGRTVAVVFAAAVGLLMLTKPVNGLVLALTLVATAAIMIVAMPGARGRRANALAVIAALVSLFDGAALTVLGLPGITSSFQDLFTDHFARPDVMDPVGKLLDLDASTVHAWISQLRRLPTQPTSPLALLGATGAIGVAGLFASRRSWLLPWIIGIPATVLVVLLHPVDTEMSRLLAPVWPAVALGLGAWLSRLEARAIAGWPGGPLRAGRADRVVARDLGSAEGAVVDGDLVDRAAELAARSVAVGADLERARR